jgi:ribosomal protein S18 acetylase RimI-like enzyme
MLDLVFLKAEKSDADRVTTLLNSAYRGESSRLGWTTEADLLDGSRTDSTEILQLLSDPDSLILLCKADEVLMGTVLLQHVEEAVELGMFAVDPIHQGMGIGKQLLQKAEQIAAETWMVKRLVMAVISNRIELIEFYQRRGYRLTGTAKAFPVNAALWTPKLENLKLVYLEKWL